MSEIEIEIEICKNCEKHKWFTSHDPAKYTDMYKNLANAITSQFPQVKLVVNSIPPTYKKIETKNIYEDLYFDMTKNRMVTKPRIGAFEITIDKTIIFSKLECSRWPHIPSVLSAIKKYIDDNSGKPVTENVHISQPKTPNKSLKLKSSYSSSRPNSRSKQSTSAALSLKDYSSIDNNFISMIPETVHTNSRMNRTYDYRESRAPSGESKISSLFFRQKMFTNNIPQSPLKRTHQEVDKDMRNLGKRSKMLLQQIPGAHQSGGFDPFLTADFMTNRSLGRGLKSHIKPLPRPLTSTFDSRGSRIIKERSNTVDNRRNIVLSNNFPPIDKKRRSVDEIVEIHASNVNVLDEDITKVLQENLLRTLTNKSPRQDKTSKRYEDSTKHELEERDIIANLQESERNHINKVALEMLKPKNDPKDDLKESSRSKSKVAKSYNNSDAGDNDLKSSKVEEDNVSKLLERLEQAEEALKTARRSDPNNHHEDQTYTHPNSCTENSPRNKPVPDHKVDTKDFIVEDSSSSKANDKEEHKIQEDPPLEKKKSSKQMLLENA